MLLLLFKEKKKSLALVLEKKIIWDQICVKTMRIIWIFFLSPARSRNLTEKNNMVTSLNRSSQRRENQGKRGRTAQRNCEKKLSSSSLSSRVTLPQSATAQKSLVVQGSSPSNLRKKENGERRGDTKLRDAPRNARPSDFEMDFDTDYVKQTITGVNQFMASSKNKGGAASKNNNSRKGQLTEDRGQREREQRGRRNRRCEYLVEMMLLLLNASVVYITCDGNNSQNWSFAKTYLIDETEHPLEDKLLLCAWLSEETMACEKSNLCLLFKRS